MEMLVANVAPFSWYVPLARERKLGVTHVMCRFNGTLEFSCWVCALSTVSGLADLAQSCTAAGDVTRYPSPGQFAKESISVETQAPPCGTKAALTTLCARGDIENRIKELHDGLQIGRTSCCRFWANQLRVLLTGRGLRLDARTPVARGSHRVCTHPGDLAA